MMQRLPIFSIVLLLLGQGASGENIRRREVEDTNDNNIMSINITINGVLELTVFEYHEDRDMMRFCLRMNVTIQCFKSIFQDLWQDDVSKPTKYITGWEETYLWLRVQQLKRNYYYVPWTMSYNVSMKVHIYGQSEFSRPFENEGDKRTEIVSNDAHLALKDAWKVSAAERAISYKASEFLKIQCFKSIYQDLWQDDVLKPTKYITGWEETYLWLRVQQLKRNYYYVPWTMSYNVSMKVHIYSQSEFSRPFENDCFEFYGSTAIIKSDYMLNPKDPNILYPMLQLQEGQEVARIYNEAISQDVEQLFRHYVFCEELNTDQKLIPEQLVKKSDPVNNTKFFEEVNTILENRHETPEKTLHELDQLSLAWAVEDRPVTVVKDDVAVVVPDKLVRGLRVSTAAGRKEFEKYSFDFLDEAPSPRIMRSQETEVVVTLPPSALTQRHVSFVVFQNESLFPSQPNGFVINSLVISVNIKNVTHFHRGEVIDIHFRPIAQPGRNESQSCAYWRFLENSTGYWSQEGCDFIRATEDGMLDICRCNHLTHFANILVPKTVFSEANERALEILTIAGCSLSIMGLIIVGATALLFRSWRQEFRNKIWLQMCMAILILVVTFLVVIFVHYDRYHVKCLLLGVTLHYAVLASFCWMLVAAVLAYRQLALVFSRDVPHKLLRAAVFAWGAPAVVCLVCLSVSPESYAGRFQEMTPGGNFCYPMGLSLWLAVYAPISVILLTNWILLALILRSVFCSKKIRSYGEGDKALRSVSVSFTLGFLFGLPWVFGLFASNVVAAYLFTLTATFQGFVLFALLVIGNKKTRELWANKIFKKRNMPMTLVTDSDCSADAKNRNCRGAAVPTHKPTFTGCLQFNNDLMVKVIPSPAHI